MSEQPSAASPAADQQMRTQRSSYAITSLVFGILAFLMLPIVGSILAIVFAGKAKREIAASGGRLSGEGYADAGRALGIIGIILAVVAFVAIIVAYVALN